MSKAILCYGIDLGSKEPWVSGKKRIDPADWLIKHAGENSGLELVEYACYDDPRFVLAVKETVQMGHLNHASQLDTKLVSRDTADWDNQLGRLTDKIKITHEPAWHLVSRYD